LGIEEVENKEAARPQPSPAGQQLAPKP